MILALLPEAIDATKNISPYNAYAYGFVVLLLLLGGYLMYKQWMYWQNKYTSTIETVVTLLNDVNVHLNKQTDLSQEHKDIMARIADLEREIIKGK